MKKIKHLILEDGQEGKRCSCCGNALPLLVFGPCKITSDHLSSICKTCQARTSKISREKRKDEVLLRARNLYRLNAKKICESTRSYNASHPEKIKEQNRKSYAKYKEKRLVNAKAYRVANRELVNEQARRYRLEKKEREGFKFNLCKSISEGVRQSLRGSKKGAKWEELVGFTNEDLCSSLASQFKDEMSWSNYGIGCGQDRWWEIDHVKGIRHFNFNSIEDPPFQECWALNNLRPRWKDENRAWKLDDRNLDKN